MNLIIQSVSVLTLHDASQDWKTGFGSWLKLNYKDDLKWVYHQEKLKNQIYNSLIIIWLNCCRMWRHSDVVLEDVSIVKSSFLDKISKIEFLSRIEIKVEQNFITITDDQLDDFGKKYVLSLSAGLQTSSIKTVMLWLTSQLPYEPSRYNNFHGFACWCRYRVAWEYKMFEVFKSFIKWIVFYWIMILKIFL